MIPKSNYLTKLKLDPSQIQQVSPLSSAYNSQHSISLQQSQPELFKAWPLPEPPKKHYSPVRRARSPQKSQQNKNLLNLQSVNNFAHQQSFPIREDQAFPMRLYNSRDKEVEKRFQQKNGNRKRNNHFCKSALDKIDLQNQLLVPTGSVTFRDGDLDQSQVGKPQMQTNGTASLIEFDQNRQNQAQLVAQSYDAAKKLQKNRHNPKNYDFKQEQLDYILSGEQLPLETETSLTLNQQPRTKKYLWRKQKFKDFSIKYQNQAVLMQASADHHKYIQGTDLIKNQVDKVHFDSQPSENSQWKHIDEMVNQLRKVTHQNMLIQQKYNSNNIYEETTSLFNTKNKNNNQNQSPYASIDPTDQSTHTDGGVQQQLAKPIQHMETSPSQKMLNVPLVNHIPLKSMKTTQKSPMGRDRAESGEKSMKNQGFKERLQAHKLKSLHQQQKLAQKSRLITAQPESVIEYPGLEIDSEYNCTKGIMFPQIFENRVKNLVGDLSQINISINTPFNRESQKSKSPKFRMANENIVQGKASLKHLGLSQNEKEKRF